MLRENARPSAATGRADTRQSRTKAVDHLAFDARAISQWRHRQPYPVEDFREIIDVADRHDAVFAQAAQRLGHVAADQQTLDGWIALSHRRHDFVDQPSRRIEIWRVTVAADECDPRSLRERNLSRLAVSLTTSRCGFWRRATCFARASASSAEWVMTASAETAATYSMKAHPLAECLEFRPALGGGLPRITQVMEIGDAEDLPGPGVMIAGQCAVLGSVRDAMQVNKSNPPACRRRTSSIEP